MANLFSIPQYIVTGEGALEMSIDYFKSFGSKALIVTDSIMIKLGNIKKLTDILDTINIKYEIYSEINSEPTDTMINSGANIYKESSCDFLIGLGGGSPLDSMKAIGVVVSGGDNICDYMGKIITKEIPPTCAIPTTAGTGSEATQFTIITNTSNDVKMLLKGPALMTKLAIVDPIFTLTVPPTVTAATGLDALTHAIEAYTSVKSFSMSDTYAVSAIKRIFKNLYEVYSNGSNSDSRTEMAIAALEAGISFNNSSVTIVHGMSRPIGALFHVPHGLSNAMLLEKCLQFAVSGAVDKFCSLSKEIGVFKEGMSEIDGANEFINSVCILCHSLNIQTPEQFGIDKKTFMDLLSKMSEDALTSGSPSNTRRLPSKCDIINIYKSLWD